MGDPFRSLKRRIVRANEHISAFKAGADAFFDMQPYTRVVERDPETGGEIRKLALTRPLPDHITDLAFEAIEALRSALDQAGYAAAVAGGAVRPKSSYFPIADFPGELDHVIKRRCKDIPPDVVTLFRSFRPYKGGNGLVWAMNKACNTSKHCLLQVLGVTASSMLWVGVGARDIGPAPD
jgi:hypothetical protein